MRWSFEIESIFAARKFNLKMPEKGKKNNPE